jgi:hypothetical protein
MSADISQPSEFKMKSVAAFMRAKLVFHLSITQDGLSIPDLIELTGLAEETVRREINALREFRHPDNKNLRLAHVVGWDHGSGNHRIRLFKLGWARDVARPPRTPRRIIQQRYDERRGRRKVGQHLTDFLAEQSGIALSGIK